MSQRKGIHAMFLNARDTRRHSLLLASRLGWILNIIWLVYRLKICKGDDVVARIDTSCINFKLKSDNTSLGSTKSYRQSFMWKMYSFYGRRSAKYYTTRRNLYRSFNKRGCFRFTMFTILYIAETVYMQL